MRRRRPKVVWIPATNANSLDQANLRTGYQVFVLNLAGVIAGAQVTGVIPLVLDGQSDDPLAPATSLADLENSSYRLRRVVGKIFAAVHQQAGDSPTAAIVTAGLIVLRSDALSGLPLAAVGNYSLAEIANWDDPWIWRRSWILANRLATNAATQAFAVTAAGTTNFEIGGNADGPHVDQKTARVVGTEERLFLVVTASVIGSQTDPQGPTMDISILTDLRVLGSMRTNQGNRRNASR